MSFDDDDLPLFESCRRWTINAQGYVCKAIWGGGATNFLHRLILSAPRGSMVDHVDGNPLNNRRSNIRLCTHAQNMKNRRRHKTNASGFKGVSHDPGRSRIRPWRAKIQVDGTEVRLGSFETAEAAYAAYCLAAKELHGEFARLA